MLCRYYANVHLIAVGWRNGQQMADVIDRKIKKNPWSWDCFGVCAWVSFSCQSCYSGRILFGFFYFKDDSNKSLLISLVSFSDSFDGFSFSVNAVIRSLILSSFFGDTYATGKRKSKRIKERERNGRRPCGGSANYKSAEQKLSSVRHSPSVFCLSWSRADLSQVALSLLYPRFIFLL